MEDKSKILEALKQYSLKSQNKILGRREVVLGILKDAIDNPDKYAVMNEIDEQIRNEINRILLEIDERKLIETEKTIDEILKPSIH